MALPVPVVMHEYEVPESRVFRLSAANGFPSAKLFMKLTRMRSANLAQGRSDALSRLSKWSGADVDMLGRYASVKVSRYMTWRLGAAVFNKEARRGKHFRYCPACIVSDLDYGSGRHSSRPYIRPSWVCKAIKNCTAHRRPLEEAPYSPVYHDDFCRFVADQQHRIRAQADKVAAEVPMAVDLYCEDRIRGVASNPFLDGFEAHVVVDLCTHLGHFVKRYRRVRGIVSKDLLSFPSREIGFNVAQQGEVHLRQLIERVIQDKRPTGQDKFIFGSLGVWLRRNSARPEFQRIVELFQDIAERNLPFGPGDKCFIPVRRRYVHSVFSASKEYGLFERRVTQLMLDAGLINDTLVSSGRVYFDAEKSAEILLAASRTITSTEARNVLGIREDVMARLLQTGIIPRVESHNNRRNYSRIRREDLDGFLLGVFAKVDVGHVEKTWVTFDYFCQVAVCKKEDVLAAILDGSLGGVAAPHDHHLKLNALRFDPVRAVQHFASLRKTLSELAGCQALNNVDAARHLRVKSGTIPHLVRIGLLEMVSVHNPVNNNLQQVIPISSLNAFRLDHVAVSEVAALYETHPMVLLDACAKIGILPIYDCARTISRFFRRHDLVDAPIDIPKFRRRR